MGNNRGIMTAATVWQEALAYIQGKVPKQVYDTWFTPVRLERIEDSTAQIGVPNKFFGEWLGQHYKPLLEEAVSTARGGGETAVSFVVFNRHPSSQTDPATLVQAVKTATATKPRRGIQLNPKYTFKNFVVGARNKFAHAACMAVAEQPAKAYNPLFIYGGVGLGKTHLLNAIANHVAERTDLRIAYLTTEQFTKDMPDIEERLRSRFEWGLIADLQPPDVETRIAILRKKSEDEGVTLPEDVIQFLSTTMKSNIRELEGSLVRLGAYASLTGQAITLDMARNVLRDLIGDKKKIVSMEDIQEVVSTWFHVKIADLKSRRRSKTLVHPRQIAMYLCRELTDASYPEIGRHFGGKDHTTIIHACRQVTKAKDGDTTLSARLEILREEILRG